MTNDEYGQLVEFIGRKFDEVDRHFEQVDRHFEQVDRHFEQVDRHFEQVDRHFEQVDARFEQVATKEEVRMQQAETRRHFDVVAERMQNQIQLVAEGVGALNQRLDRFERKVEEDFAETRAAIRFSYAQLERRIQELEGNYASLDERVARLEPRSA